MELVPLFFVIFFQGHHQFKENTTTQKKALCFGGGALKHDTRTRTPNFLETQRVVGSLGVLPTTSVILSGISPLYMGGGG